MTKELIYYDVDVILATYNGIANLPEQIDSILAQQGVNVRLLAFDDCSVDGTRALLNNYAAAGVLEICGWDFSTGGAFQNFNAAVQSLRTRSSADYVAFCDQDDIWVADKLVDQIRVLLSTGAYGCSSSVTAFVDGVSDSSRYIDNVGTQTVIDFYFEGGGQGCSYVFKRELLSAYLRDVPHLDVTLPHDWMLYAYCRLSGRSWVILPSPKVKYRQHASNAFGARGSFTGYLRRARMLGSGSFRNRRLRVCQTLKNSAVGYMVPLELIHPKFGVLSRLSFAFSNFFAFRRFRLHAMVVAVMYVIGLA